MRISLFNAPHAFSLNAIHTPNKFQAARVGAGCFYGAVRLAWFPDPVTSEKQFGGVIGKSDGQ